MSPIKSTFDPVIMSNMWEINDDLPIIKECPCEGLITRIADYVTWFFK